MNPNYWKYKRVFITGHTGFKGSWLCMMLKKMGAQVFGYSKDRPTKPSLYDLANLDLDVTSRKGDVLDRQALNLALVEAKPTHLIHMAAQTIVKEGFINPGLTFETNVMGTLNVLQACRENPVINTVLIVTTDKVYGEKGSIWGYRETDPVNSADPYSTSKACADLITSCYRESFMSKFGKNVATARAGNVVGGGDFSYRLIPMTMDYLLKGDKPPIWDPSAVRPWQSVLDCLSGYLTLMEYANINPKEYGGAWNFGPPIEECLPVGEVIDKLCALWSGGIVSWDSARCPVRYNLGVDIRLSPQKANQLLGWKPKWNIEETINSIIRWYKGFENIDNIKEVCERELEQYGL